VRYRAVFFDAGETLVHPYPSFPDLLARVLGDAGHDVTPDAIRERLGVISDRFVRAARDRELWSTSPQRSSAFWAEIYQVLLGAMGLPWTDPLADRLYTTFTDVSNYRLFDDVVDTLEDLAAAGYELGLISNFEQWLEMLLEHLDVTRFFEVRVISGAEGVEKPDPRIFRLALDRAGVAPEESVYVGDTVEFDVRPAEEAGMLGVLLDRRERYPDAPHPRIATLSELPALLGSRGGEAREAAGG
jgi:putative hydrolase of the HAD superfamily